MVRYFGYKVFKYIVNRISQLFPLMAQHNETGKTGENIAAEYLQREGYFLLEQNWRHRKAEIDLIVKQNDILVFVEVKTRSNTFFSDPELSVDEQKQALITNAAMVYMEEIGHEWEVRFDIIAVILESEDSFDIRHYEDAFFPGMR